MNENLFNCAKFLNSTSSLLSRQFSFAFVAYQISLFSFIKLNLSLSLYFMCHFNSEKNSSEDNFSINFRCENYLTKIWYLYERSWETFLWVQTLFFVFPRNNREKKKWKVFWTFDLRRHFFFSFFYSYTNGEENFLMNKKIEFVEE